MYECMTSVKSKFVSFLVITSAHIALQTEFQSRDPFFVFLELRQAFDSFSFHKYTGTCSVAGYPP